MKRFWTSVIFLVLLSSELEAGRRFGGRSGGRRSSSSSSGGGWFGSKSSSSNSRKSSSSNSASSYPKQQWGGSSGGTNTGAKQPAVGGGGFVNPKPASNAGGFGGGNKQPVGGGGFVNPKQNYGTGGSSYGSGGSYGSRYGTGGTGLGGSSGGYSYRSPGYGTNFGTSFPGGVGRYGGNGYSKKALGLGVGAGFIGGAALGVAGTMATYGVYHRYNQYRYMMMSGGYGYGGYHGYGYGHHGHGGGGNNCYGGCPYAAHCEWGFCECNRGFEKRYGRCEQDWGNQQGRPANFDPFVQCMDSSSCQKMDMNLICNTNITIQAGGKCECRTDMKWNTQKSECQMYIDVDCSSITYDTKPSPVILEAVNKTLEKIAESNKTETATAELIGETIVNGTDPEDLKADNETISMAPNETLSNSLLTSIDPKEASEAEIKEAFCRDIDSFSFEFAEPQRQTHRPTNAGGRSSVGSIIGTVIAILIFFALCCVCCICCAFKGAKDKLSNAFKSNDHGQEAATGAVAFTAIQEAQQEQAGPPGYHPNPGFQSQHTPMHGGGLPYGLQPEGPPPIPPTQPGYTNTYPSLDNEAPTYPPNNSIPYPPNGGAPYPPTGGMPYPPEGAVPYGAAPYPPSNPSPYPPAYPSSGQPPYPPTSAPYPPAGQQPAYNPTAPP